MSGTLEENPEAPQPPKKMTKLEKTLSVLAIAGGALGVTGAVYGLKADARVDQIRSEAVQAEIKRLTDDAMFRAITDSERTAVISAIKARKARGRAEMKLVNCRADKQALIFSPTPETVEVVRRTESLRLQTGLQLWDALKEEDKTEDMRELLLEDQ